MLSSVKNLALEIAELRLPYFLAWFSGCLWQWLWHGSLVVCGAGCGLVLWLSVAMGVAWCSGCLWPWLWSGVLVVSGNGCGLVLWLFVAMVVVWCSGCLWQWLWSVALIVCGNGCFPRCISQTA
jgi:hypothetical protein